MAQILIHDETNDFSKKDGKKRQRTN